MSHVILFRDPEPKPEGEEPDGGEGGGGDDVEGTPA